MSAGYMIFSFSYCAILQYWKIRFLRRIRERGSTRVANTRN